MSKKKTEIPKVEPQNPATSTPEGMVVGTNPVPELAPIVMVEKTDSLESAKKAVKEVIKNKIAGFLDQDIAQIKPQLENMVVLKEIGSFVILKNGQGFDGDYESDRVQLFTQGPTEKITDIQVG